MNHNSDDRDSMFKLITKRAGDSESLVKRLKRKITLELDCRKLVYNPGIYLR